MEQIQFNHLYFNPGHLVDDWHSFNCSNSIKFCMDITYEVSHRSHGMVELGPDICPCWRIIWILCIQVSYLYSNVLSLMKKKSKYNCYKNSLHKFLIFSDTS